MQDIEGENNVLCDIDETLVRWIDPLIPGPGKVAFQYGDRTVYLTPHKANIDLMKFYVTREGFKIFAASANGQKWAKHVVETLGLQEYVSFTLTKFSRYIDDKKADEWMTQIFLPEYNG